MTYIRTSIRLLVSIALLGLPAACGESGREKPEGAAPDTMMTMQAQPADTMPRRPAVPPEPVPAFEEYAVRATFRGKPAPVDIRSAEYGRAFRTKLREGAAAGPNFADHFTVVMWGCGTGCQIIAVVDARTGKLSRQTLLTQNGVEYRRDSRLLIADPIDPQMPPHSECASCGTRTAYLWKDGRFEPLGKGPHPHLEGYRPW